MKSDLVQQIEMLSHNHETDHIIIEATGIAHPIELIMACQDPRIVQFVERPTLLVLLMHSLYKDNSILTPQSVSWKNNSR